jgi:tRNA(fMet)-specific endonuclease VapC
VYLLDTNICIYLIRKQPPKVLERLMACSPDEVALSVVTLSELAYGVSKSQAQAKNRASLELFLTPFRVLDYTVEVAFAYGEIRAELEQKGTPIGAMDLMIAAHAKATGATLVSNNLREFRRVAGLQTENWAR